MPRPTPDVRPTGPGVQRTSWFGRITQVLNIIGTVLILVMAVAVNADVIGRDVFNHPIAGVLEFIGHSIVAVVFLQMANTLRENRHISNDIFIRMAGATWPRTVAGMNAVFHLIGAALMFMIVIYVCPNMRANYVGNFYAGTAGVIEIPIWPFMAVVVLGAATTMVQFFIDAWNQFLRCSRAKAD